MAYKNEANKYLLQKKTKNKDFFLILTLSSNCSKRQTPTSVSIEIIDSI